jgi:hypothetical protein
MQKSFRLRKWNAYAQLPRGVRDKQQSREALKMRFDGQSIRRRFVRHFKVRVG